jgi:hypothetical protein
MVPRNGEGAAAAGVLSGGAAGVDDRHAQRRDEPRVLGARVAQAGRANRIARLLAAAYRKAQRVFVIVDNGSAHRGQRSIDRLQGAWPNLVLLHTPVHASWLNQAEIYFSVTQRKVFQPNNFTDLDELERTLLAFGRHYEQIAQPFDWKFTRADLHTLLARLDRGPPLQLAA